MPWIMDAQSWKIIWGQSLMSRWVGSLANSLRFPVSWKRACVLCFWFSFFWPCFPDLPSASGAVDIWCTGHLLCLADFGRLFDHRNYFIHDNMIPDTTFAKDRFFLQQWSKERPLFQRKNPFGCMKQTTFGCFYLSFHWWKNHASCRISLWWNGWLPRWLPPEIFSGKARNQGKGDIFIGTHLIPPVYQYRVQCEWLVWLVYRWTFAK